MLFDTLVFIDSVVSNLNCGLSVSKSIEKSSSTESSEIAKFSKQFLFGFEKGDNSFDLTLKLQKPEHITMFLVFQMGIKGLPIVKMLEDLRKEVLFSNDVEIEHFQKILPFKLMVPLLLFYFPALFLLFIGPFIADFLNFHT